MANTGFLDELSAALKAMLARSPAADLEKNIRALLRANFAKLDLVTREEFDAQSTVLARTRTRLEQLEQRLAEMEALEAQKK